jgi:hypothetical protein
MDNPSSLETCRIIEKKPGDSQSDGADGIRGISAPGPFQAAIAGPVARIPPLPQYRLRPGSGKLAVLLERSTDGGSLCLGDDEHAARMVTRTAGGKRQRR